MFQDRTDGGRQLAGALSGYRRPNPLVLGLPRGGVPVAVEVATALDADLDVLVVRKLGAPGNPDTVTEIDADAHEPKVWRRQIR